MNGILSPPLPATHPFSHGLMRPPATKKRSSPARPCSGRSRSSSGSHLTVPSEGRQKRLSISSHFLDVDLEYARLDVPRPKLVVTVIRPSPTEAAFPARDSGDSAYRRRVQVLQGKEEWERREAEREAEEAAEEENKRRKPSWKERRRRAKEFLERLDTFRECEEVETLDSPRDCGWRLRDGPKSAPVDHAPCKPPSELRRARSLEYHPFAPSVTSPVRHSEDDEHLDFEYLLSPGTDHGHELEDEDEHEHEHDEAAVYELPALNLGPRLSTFLRSDWDVLALGHSEPSFDHFELGLGALAAVHSRHSKGEWSKHPFAR